MKKTKRVPAVSVERLIIYRRCLLKLNASGVFHVSSAILGRLTNVKPANIRKDLSYIGEYGKPGYGYDIDKLLHMIEKVIGVDKKQEVIIIGVGNIGEALLNYQNWEERGFEISGAFDKDKRKMGRMVCGIEICGDAELSAFVQKRNVEIAIIAIPAEVTQAKVDELSSLGIRAFYVISPMVIEVPQGCYVEYIDMVSPMELLVYRHKNKISK